MFLLSFWWFPTVFVFGTLWAVSSSRDKRLPQDKKDKIQHIKALRTRNETADALVTLIERDGAGDWPPKVTFDKWPETLLPYKQILLEVLPHLPTVVPSQDNAVNAERRKNFRTIMRKLLKERIDLSSVEKLLIDVERDDWARISRDQLNAFYSCLAICRHAYGWATLPVIGITPSENAVGLPPELELPWAYVQRYFGVTADSGNHTSNILMNHDKRGDRMFKFTASLSPMIQRTEEIFFGIFYDIEVIAFDVYYNMVAAIMSSRDGRKDICLDCLRSINANVERILRIFDERLKDGHISREAWINYIQGIDGWGVERWINGELVKPNRLPSNTIPVFMALDAFLGVGERLSADDAVRYIPLNQRLFYESIGRQCFGRIVDESEDLLLQVEFNNITKRLEEYRATNLT